MWPMDDDYEDEDDTLSVAELAHPYHQSRAGPIFWCHVDARHPKIQTFLSNAYWVHPAVSVALRDEKRLISDRMKHLLYEVLAHPSTLPCFSRGRSVYSGYNVMER